MPTACFAEGCKQTSEPLCTPQPVKCAGRLVCAHTDAGHGALIAISVLQDALLAPLLCWATVNQLQSLCLQSRVGQGWDLGLLSPALLWGEAFAALGLSWSLTSDALAETNV